VATPTDLDDRSSSPPSGSSLGQPPPTRGRKSVIIALVAIVAVTIVFAIAAVRIHDRDAQPSEIRVTGIPASVSTPMANLMALSPVPNKAAPPFTLVDQTGRTVSLAALKGKSVVLEFMVLTAPTSARLSLRSSSTPTTTLVRIDPTWSSWP
jgi:hypothetical protein